VEAARNAGTDAAFVWRDHRADYDLGVTPDHELETLHDLHELTPGAGEAFKSPAGKLLSVDSRRN